MAKWKITSPMYVNGVVVSASRAHPAIIELPDSFQPHKDDRMFVAVDAVVELGKPAYAEPKTRGRPRKSFEPKDSDE